MSISKNKVNHLAIVLDGNRRWAKKRKVSLSEGYKAGVLAIEKIAKTCSKRGVKYLTVYGFSTENWGRSKTELKIIVDVLRWALEKFINFLDDNKVVLKVIGRPKDFPKSIQSLLDKSINKLKNHGNGVLTLALSYGGRDEIVRAAEKARRYKGKLTEKSFSQFLDTADLPDPEIIIRTGGRNRLSNFLPWQGAYSEIYFTNTLWPDFSPRELDRVLNDFSKQQRNFGK